MVSSYVYKQSPLQGCFYIDMSSCQCRNSHYRVATVHDSPSMTTVFSIPTFYRNSTRSKCQLLVQMSTKRMHSSLTWQITLNGMPIGSPDHKGSWIFESHLSCFYYWACTCVRSVSFSFQDGMNACHIIYFIFVINSPTLVNNCTISPMSEK